MKNLLIGNGINIEFSDKEYLNSSIIKRAIENIEKERFPRSVYPKETMQYLFLLFSEYENIISGKNDRFLIASFEQEALNNFKERYKERKIINVEDIGFEDYFLLHNIFCYKNKIDNPERSDFRLCLKRLFIDSIYNQGKILTLHKKYPSKLIEFFKAHNTIFTTNYDNNVEASCCKEVFYLHGAFHILDEENDPNSFRNILSDRQNRVTFPDKKYRYLYSNALTAFIGEVKEFSMTSLKNANDANQAFMNKYNNNSDFKKQIDEWELSSNQTLKNMYETIVLKSKNPNLKFAEYPIEKFKDISGEITIIGLSPNNDDHIFRCIKENSSLDKITYYFYDDKEAEFIVKYFGNTNIECKRVKQFWNSMKT